MFTKEICDQLQHYVYRLIDPRNGETFYVGKGKDNRVFTHAKGELDQKEDEVLEKTRRIREIRNAGLEVSHVVHRHGLTGATAYEVEAALLDAYPGVCNITGGHHSGDRGSMHAEEIKTKYEAKEAAITHPVIAITINRTGTEKKPYEAVRYAWRLNRMRAARAEYVLAVIRGLIVGVYVPEKWLEATPENFPGTEASRKGRWGFIGQEASKDIQSLYCGKRIPGTRKRGAANPVRYFHI